MGLLDDAIREHLELKRRHGADPTEVERQEQEALGPARRGAAPAADADADAAADRGSVGTLDEAEAPDAYYDDEVEYEDDDLFEDDVEEPAAVVPAAEPEAPVAPPVREERDPADQTAVDDRPAPTEADLEDVEPPGAPAPDAEEPAGKDVLEETPEFLEETPEHDRLWFEQKPPRDFEF
jgi:hypothetical protein